MQVRQLAVKVSKLPKSDTTRIQTTENLLNKLYHLGVIDMSKVGEDIRERAINSII